MTAPARGRVRDPLPRAAKVGLGLVAFVLIMAVAAPVVARRDPAQTGIPFSHPSSAHLLGTDDVGHDLWANLVFGARVSVFVGLTTAVISLAIALIVSLVAVYKRGWFETIAFRIVDLTLVLPFLILVIVVAVFIGRSILATIAVLSCVLWARPARVLRASALRLRETPHVAVAMASGAPASWVIRRHLLARIAPQVVAQFVRLVNFAVLSEAALAFLGLGDPGRVSWGTTLFFANSHNAFLTGAWLWWILPPAVGLTVLSCGLALIGFGVEERSDPRLRSSFVGGRVSRRKNQDPVAPGGSIERSTSVAVRDLVVEYEREGLKVRAVDGVTLEIEARSVVGLIGESGCGKSSLASAIMGLVGYPGRVLAGRLAMDGVDYDLCKVESVALLRGRALSLVPQSAMNALNPSQRVRSQVVEAAALGGSDPRRRAEDALSSLQIPPEEQVRFPHQLSGGQRQRVVLATAMVNAPSLVIADEATSGLDPLTQLDVLRALTDRCTSQNSGLLLISHDLPLVGKVADRIVVMYAGRIVEEGPTSSVLNAPLHPYTTALLAAYPRVDGSSVPRSIPGDVPDLRFLPSGCAFRTRCVRAEPRCATKVPPLLTTGTHAVACVVVSDSHTDELSHVGSHG